LHDIDNAALCQIIYQLERAGYVMQGPGLGAIQTTGNFLMINHPAVERLKNAFIEFIRSSGTMDPIITVSGWANIGKSSDPAVDPWHNDMPWNWGAGSCPAVPKFTQRGEGQIRFGDPRGCFERFPDASFTPQAGMMILFPSWLEHTVAPF